MLLTTLHGLCNCPDAVTGVPRIPHALPGKPEVSFDPSLLFSLPIQSVTLLLGYFSEPLGAIFPFYSHQHLPQVPCHLLFTPALSWWVFLHPLCMILPNMYDQIGFLSWKVFPAMHRFAIHSFDPPWNCPALTHLKYSFSGEKIWKTGMYVNCHVI